MFTDYVVNAENMALFDKICNKLKSGPKVKHFLNHDFNTTLDHQSEEPSEKVPMSSNLLELSKEKDVVFDADYDLYALQKDVLLNPLKISKLEDMTIDPAMIISDERFVVDDDVVIEMCSKFPLTPANILIYTELLLLPKLYHSCGNISEPVSDVIHELLRSHEEEIVSGALCPLLKHSKHCYQYADLLVNLLSKPSSASMVKLIRALSANDVQEADLEIFNILLCKIDPHDEHIHNQINLFLNGHQSRFSESAKFGRCLLNIVRKIATFMSDKETLKFSISAHQSNIKNAVESLFKKIQ